MTSSVFQRLNQRIIQSGLCSHCGTCVGLSNGTLAMVDTEKGPLPHTVDQIEPILPQLAWDACPGKGLHMPHLYESHFGSLPKNWLIRCYKKIGVGYSTIPHIRRGGASGGVITQTLLYLLEQRLIEGAIVVRQGHPRPWLASPIIATTAEEIREASQSVYVPVPVNTLLPQMIGFNGRLAYVGLPDQVASLRHLQRSGHPGARKVEYVLGPYMGTAMYFGAIESYLHANGINDVEEITQLDYRAGEWPGYLQIVCRSGQILRAEKFHYNYLIPFYITKSSLFSVDFTNELTDISVGDAWHPRYEVQGGGFSVVVARSSAGQSLVEQMQSSGVLHFDEVPLDTALSMHGHMLDFKKRGAFIRMGWRAALGREVPDYGYSPQHIAASRKAVELLINTIFTLCGTRLARRVVNWVPIALLGPVFNFLRKNWKRLSKPTKREGLSEVAFSIDTWMNPEMADRKE